MKRLLAFVIVFANIAAFAEGKPAGTVLDSLCGHLNKSVQVCLAQVTGTPRGKSHTYIVLRHFTKEPVYIFASKQKNVYQGYAVSKETEYGRYNVEKHYALSLTKNGSKILGTLYVNGKPVSQTNIPMETMRHTM